MEHTKKLTQIYVLKSVYLRSKNVEKEPKTNEWPSSFSVLILYINILVLVIDFFF